MLIDWFTVSAQAVNFLILVWLMKRYLYQPILVAIDAREKRIAADERNRIFEAFYQGKTPQGGHVKGTGIGLSVVTEFVNAHGGSIEILESKSGGAHFRVRLPLRHTVAAIREKAHAA